MHTTDEEWSRELAVRHQQWLQECWAERHERRMADVRRERKLRKRREAAVRRNAERQNKQKEEQKIHNYVDELYSSRDKDREIQRYKNRIARGLPEPSRPEPEDCECCGTPFWLTGLDCLHLDHCHKTGEFRGWLCSSCNTGMGMLRDSVDGALDAVEYLLSNDPSIVQPARPLKAVKYLRTWLQLHRMTGLS